MNLSQSLAAPRIIAPPASPRGATATKEVGHRFTGRRLRPADFEARDFLRNFADWISEQYTENQEGLLWHRYNMRVMAAQAAAAWNSFYADQTNYQLKVYDTNKPIRIAGSTHYDGKRIYLPYEDLS